MSRKSFVAMATLLLSFPLWKLSSALEHTTDAEYRAIILSLCLSVLGCYATIKIIPIFMKYNLSAGLGGIDINKSAAPPKKVPEALGLVSGFVFLTSISLYQVIYVRVSPEKMDDYNAGVLCVCFMLLLGFTDDVLNLPWRYKLILPSMASLPLLVAYDGVTTVVMPKFVRPLVGTFVELGPLYYVYMYLTVVYCTNTINIHAGINGLEAGQAFVIACAVLTYNILQLDDVYTRPQMLFSAGFIIPFIGVTIGLLWHNWYPSRVFVGDTYTYFAGVIFAVVAILGHFSKTVMLFFIPQWINFFYSLPQILGIVYGPCPRHRLPRFDSKTGLLHARPTHLNLINLILVILGPMKESSLTMVCMGFQAVCCAVGFMIRYQGAGLLY